MRNRLAFERTPAAAEPVSSKEPHDAALRRILTLPTAPLGLAYLAGYVLLDWLSFVEPYGVTPITPWDPTAGLSIAFALLLGWRTIPFLFIAPVLGDLVVLQRIPLPLGVELTCAGLIAGVYGAAGLLLAHPKLRFDRALRWMRDLFVLTTVTVVSTAVVASGYVGLTIAAGLLPTAEFTGAALRYWVGDVIGVMVVVPFGLILLTRRNVLGKSGEVLLQSATIIAALMIVFGYANAQQLQLFYLLFLPIVWMAVRTGIEGVSFGILITQLGLIVGVQLSPSDAHDLAAIQALMVVLALTGLFAGQLVTERRLTEAVLRIHQESLARLGSVGELSAAVAHELNQPLMAIGTYTRMVRDAIRSADADAAIVAEAAEKAVKQADRAAEIVRRLRALVRLDRSNRAACRVDQIVRETIDLCRPDLERQAVNVRLAISPDLPPVMVDARQIEQVLVNLVRNSLDAIDEVGQGTVSIEAALADMNFVEVRVLDSGPGFPPEVVADPFVHFFSTKTEGLGIGLSLCRSLIEAHGGRIWLGVNSPGAVVHFTLPVARLSFPRPVTEATEVALVWPLVDSHRDQTHPARDSASLS
jgi:two-component system, LuxR family, sensor kinase FixL